ncbi:MAG: hypothetical protein AB7D39_20955 [Pseudodesulfovibrio sp.]|uniref:hypothetical protein n=1 Tax=Pseudodesulfovibrio sp. TaxID=2035812 RepID=UPI003D14B7ED
MAGKQTETKTTAEAVMYIGPTKMGALHVTNGAVFRGGKLPEHLATAIKVKGNEAFASLFVSVSNLGPARASLRVPGSDLGRAFKAAGKMEG